MVYPVDGRIVCRECKEDKPESLYYHIARTGHYNPDCKECFKEKVRTVSGPGYRTKVRAEVIAAYGGECKCCGETWPPYMCIDHVNGEGNADRLEKTGVRLNAGYKFYVALRRLGYPEGYQLLCFNCNMGKDRTGGCPPHHKLYGVPR